MSDDQLLDLEAALSAIRESMLSTDRDLWNEMDALASRVYKEHFAFKRKTIDYAVFLGCLIERLAGIIEKFKAERKPPGLVQ